MAFGNLAVAPVLSLWQPARPGAQSTSTTVGQTVQTGTQTVAEVARAEQQRAREQQQQAAAAAAEQRANEQQRALAQIELERQRLLLQHQTTTQTGITTTRPTDIEAAKKSQWTTAEMLGVGAAVLVVVGGIAVLVYQSKPKRKR